MADGAIAVFGADRSTDRIDGGQRALQRLVAAADRAGIVKAAELLAQERGLAQQAPANLFELHHRIAGSGDLLHDIARPAIIERQQRIEGARRLAEILDDVAVLEEIFPEL